MTESTTDRPIGYRLPTITRTFTQDIMTMYRNHLGLRVKELSAPVKDFHTDTEEARKLGFLRRWLNRYTTTNSSLRLRLTFLGRRGSPAPECLRYFSSPFLSET